MVSENSNKYVFTGKTVFFPKEKILVVGDLHLGYEEALRQRGLDVPINQFKEAESELKKTMEYIKEKYGKIEKVIFLGDIKHHFSYLFTEREELRKLLSFVRKQGVEEQDIIFIRGNHEKNERNGKYVDYYIVKDIAFIHGHREFPEIYAKEINLIVMGHLHPTILLEDKMKIKREKYKCFLVGRYKKKDFIVVPSFLSITEGVAMSEFGEDNFGIVPNPDLQEFEVYVASELGEEALDFGKLKNL